MKRCSRCGSFAINHHSHGRDGSDPDLCDVCYWRKRAEFGGSTVTDPLTDEQKHARNPYRHSRGAASIWLNGFAAAELWYRIGIKKENGNG